MNESHNANAVAATKPVASPIYRPLRRSLACVGVFSTACLLMAVASIVIRSDNETFFKEPHFRADLLALVLCAFVGMGLAGTGMVRSLTAAAPAPKAFLGGLALWAVYGVLLMYGAWVRVGG
jgi:hypothetical protein